MNHGTCALLAAAAISCGGGSPPAGLDDWLTAWEGMRRCLVGDAPEGSDLAAAAGVAELSGSTAQGCRGRLAGHGPDDSQRGGVFDRWRSSHREAVELPLVRPPAERAAAVADLDGQVGELYARAGRSPPARGAPVLPPPLAGARELTIDGHPMIATETAFHERLFWAGGIRSSAIHGDFLGDSPDQLQERRHPPGTELAYPSGAWAAGDAAGDPSTDALAIREPPTALPRPVARLPGQHAVSAAMDAGAARAIFLEPLAGQPQAFTLVVSVDAGRSWRVISVPGPGDFRGHQQDPRTGAVDIITRTAGGWQLYRFTAIDPEHLPAPVELPGYAHLPCSHQGVHWAAEGGILYRIDGSGGAEFDLVPFDANLVDCRAGAALALARHPDRLARCRAGRCAEVHRAGHRRPGAAALLDDGSWIYAAAAGDVVGVWREGADAPRFHRIDSTGELVAITVLRARPYLVLLAPRGAYQLVPLEGEGG